MSARFIHIFRDTLSREDKLALEAATEWILVELETNRMFHGSDTTVEVMRRIAQKEIRRPRDGIHRHWAELFIRETDEIEFDHVRPEIRKLAQRGNVTPEEIAGLRCNSWEWEFLVPAMTDEALVEQAQHALSNCSPGRRPFTTYDKAVCGLYGPELLRRFHSQSRVGEGLAHTYTVNTQLYALALVWAEGAASGINGATVRVVEQGGARIPCVLVESPGFSVAFPVGELLRFLRMPLPYRSN